MTGYSPANTPHLSPALEIDDLIIEFSASLQSKGLPTSIASASDVDILIGALRDELTKLKLWQYYVLDIVKERQAVKDALAKGDITPWSGSDIAHKTVVELAEIVRDFGIVKGLQSLEKRYVAHADGPVAAGVVKAAFVDIGNDADALADAWIRVVDVLNVPLYREWEEDTAAAVDQIKGRVKYTRLDDHGPKLGLITRECVPIYLDDSLRKS